MQLGQLARIANARWAAILGGIAGGASTTVLQTQFSTVSPWRTALFGALFTSISFLLLLVISNLAGIMPIDSGDDEAMSGR